MLSDLEREKLRNRFRPNEVNVLYIGESPPAQGTFFYSTNSILFNEIHKSFKKVYLDCGDGIEFLNYFKSRCFYLEDLCHYPVNKLTKTLRIAARKKEINNLSIILMSVKPLIVVSLMKAINPEIEEAIKLSGVKIKLFEKLPFPRPEHQKQFQYQHEKFLLKL